MAGFVTGADAVANADVSRSWSESLAGEFMYFAAGYAIIYAMLRGGLLAKLFPGSLGDPAVKAAAQRRRVITKDLRAASSAGDHAAVRAMWDREKAQGPVPLPALQDVVSTLLAVDPDAIAVELPANLALYPAKHAQQAMRSLVETLLQADRRDIADKLEEALRRRAPRTTTSSTATPKGGTTCKASASPKGLSCFTSFFKTTDVEVAAKQILDRRLADVPANVVNALFTLACDSGEATAKRVFVKLQGAVKVPIESYGMLLDQCLSSHDVSFARHLDRLAHAQHPKMHYSIYEPLLKIFAKASDARALDILGGLERHGHAASEGLCGCLLARSGEARNLALVERLAEYCSTKSLMTLAIFKTLMKAYASCCRYDLACDLYEQVLAAGLEPDSVMYGCLVKFAVKCGRRELSERLFRLSKGEDNIQNYMWLIRAAGRDGSVGQAEDLFREAEGRADAESSLALHNCMLDVYVSNGKVAEADRFFERAKGMGQTSVVTYNTMVKSFCAKGQLARARRTFADMEQQGITPDSASYNHVLAGIADHGKLDCVWDLLDEMRAKKVPLDSYTVAIMMKVAKKARSPVVAGRALAVLDTVPCAELFEDEVLFNTVLDACIQCRSTRRLASAVAAYPGRTLRPSVPTFGLMIKACGILKQIKQCWELWREMVEVGGHVPSGIALSCMMDALISARRVDDAVALFRDWQGRVPPNIVMYGTLIKGFANLGDADRAMGTYEEIRAAGIAMNLLAYTSLIDANCRAGRLVCAEDLLARMTQEGIQPSIITHSAIVRGHCVLGDLESAFALFGRMCEQGIKPDAVLFNTLLDGCVKNSRFQLADHLLAEMGRRVLVQSAFTISIVIKLWGKRRQLDRAFDAVRSGARSGITFDVQVVTSLISACFFNQAPDRAAKVLDEIGSWPGCQADAVVYGALLSGLLRCGALPLAVQVAHRALLHDSVSSEIHGGVWGSLLQALSTQGDRQEWVAMMAGLRSAGIDPSVLSGGNSQPSSCDGGPGAGIQRRRR